MTLYSLLHPTKLGEFYARLRGPADGGDAWFIQDTWPEGPMATLDVDVEIPARRFSKVAPDFLQTTRGVILLSPRFVENLEDSFLSDAQLIPARLHLEGAVVDFYAVRILTTRRLVIPEASDFFEIRGIRILRKAVYDQSQYDFAIAHDVEFRDHWAVTDRIVDLVKDRRLNVEVMPAF